MSHPSRSRTHNTIPRVLAEGLSWRGADFPVLDFSGQHVTYSELDVQSTRLARGLRELGIQHGDTIVSLLDNGPDQVVLLFACGKLGAIHVPVNTAYKGEFLRHQVHDSGARVLIAESEYIERLLDLETQLPEAQILLYRGAGSERQPQRWSVKPLPTALSDNVSPFEVTTKPSDLAMLIYTAGTTGPSKGCMVSHNYACNLARQLSEGFRLTSDDVMWTPLPGFHLNMICATMLSTMMAGGRASVYSRFSVSNFWPDVERSGATIVSLLATMLSMVADAPDNEASLRYRGKLRTVIGAPFPDALLNKWRERFGVKSGGSIGFGLTECSIITSSAVDEPRPPNSSGRRNDDFDVRIVDDDDEDVPVGQAGEIIVRPRKPHVMFEGFWKRPQDSMKQLRNLWYHTGDMGRFDEQGYFYFVDRKKDYLRRRGENISSFEMEAAFRAHPALQEIAVHAVLSPLGEDEVKLTATLRPGATPAAEDVCLWAVDHVPYFAVPRYIEFRAELPKNPVGRVLKYQLRDEGITAGTWDREKAGVQIKRR